AGSGISNAGSDRGNPCSGWVDRAVISSNQFDEAVFDQLFAIFRSTAVSRGDIAMPPGELLPLRLPVAVEK
ncbi:DUF3710 domain-containing protein, partial [Aquiluna sp.]|nr:DUF3710 domain-containing protein [Aquiluna sp.]